MKASLDKKCKYVVAIIGTPKYPLTRSTEFYYERLKQWCSSACEFYFFIEHSKDTLETGELKHRHIHMVLYLNNAQTRLLTTLNAIACVCELDGMSVGIDKCVDKTGAIQYLIHKNDLNKYQYQASDIVTNVPSNELDTLLNTESDNMSATYLISVVQQYKGNRLDILRHIGLGYYHLYRQVINDIINEIYL